MVGLRAVAARIIGVGISCTLWVDGSFLTNKIDPFDVDLVAFMPARFSEDGNADQIAVADWLSSGDNEPEEAPSLRNTR